ncbi:MAG: acyltransferase 3 [Ilumatobacteraceae bacterium]|nr:acyltransferase 3 [Ilumatobacteraceae bacterium]
MLIGASATGTGNPGRLLATPQLGWIGKRSYSLYLWHLPILVLAAARWGPLTAPQRVLAVLAAMTAAAISFALLEDPIPRRAVVQCDEHGRAAQPLAAGGAHQDGLPDSRCPDDTSWKAGLDRTLTMLRPEASRVLVLGDTPTPMSDVPACVAGHVRDVGVCMSTRAAAVRPGRLQAEAEVAAAHDAAFVSTDDWLCTDQFCPVVIGDVLVYRDDSHLTTTAAALLTPYVEAMLRPLLPAP